MNSITNDELISNTFYITYAFLMTTATITFIEAIRTKNPKIRNILNLETCISVVAAFYYGQFVDDLQEGVNYEKINLTRYVDWSITTPIMLLVLVLALLFNNKKGPMKFANFLIILFFNYVMLGFGYAGEIGMLDKTLANVLGFGGFAGLYYFIYDKYIKNYNNKDNNMLFISFLVLWAMYGVFYMLDDVTRNVGYNVLDLLSKCFVGIFFWAYYTGVFKL
jgi:bacteriorhodopsin|tara:strand:- start:6413 stop:7075 length:663 start_codon:yes stop_codon:yes gene_type:complete